MKSIVFDTSSIISLTMNNLIDVLKELKKSFDGNFLIPKKVKEELVDKPLKTRTYGLEAMMVSKVIDDGYLRVADSGDTNRFEMLVNTLFRARGEYIRILHQGEIEALVLAMSKGADAFVVDERTSRLLIEDPVGLHKLLERKLHTKVIVNKDNLKEINKLTKGIKIIRSTELMFVAYENGLLKNYIPQKYPRREQLNALLWSLRLKGCSISVDEIEGAERV